MAKNTADRIRDAGSAIAEIFRGGELAIIGIIAVVCGRGAKNAAAKLRRLSDQATRRSYEAQVNAALAELQAQAQQEARRQLAEMYQRTAEEIEAFADSLAIDNGGAELITAESEAIAREAEEAFEALEPELRQAAMEAQEAVDSMMRELTQAWIDGLRHMRRSADDIYRQVVEAEAENRDAGGTAVRRAVDAALRRFADSGVTGFTDNAGRSWGLAEYSDMAMRTAMQRVNLAATLRSMLSHGLDVGYVNRHMGACPKCLPWHGRLISITGRTSGYPTLQEAMLDGLFHPNCAHILLAYIPGVSRLDIGAPIDYSDSDNNRLFLARQQQRAMEREVRKWKRRQAAATNSADELTARRMVSEWQRRLREHVAGNNQLVRRYDREGGRVRSIASLQEG